MKAIVYIMFYMGNIVFLLFYPFRENNSQHTQTIFQADPSGFFEKGNIHKKMIITIRVINLIKKEFMKP
jgi:hypothetical protein